MGVEFLLQSVGRMRRIGGRPTNTWWKHSVRRSAPPYDSIDGSSRCTMPNSSLGGLANLAAGSENKNVVRATGRRFSEDFRHRRQLGAHLGSAARSGGLLHLGDVFALVERAAGE